MMDGITVLSQSELYEMPTFFIPALIAVYIIGSALAIINAFIENYDVAFMFVSFIVLCGLCVCVFGFANSKPTGEFVYQVIISEDIDLNEFNEKYEIIEQEDKVCTIKERKN